MLYLISLIQTFTWVQCNVLVSEKMGEENFRQTKVGYGGEGVALVVLVLWQQIPTRRNRA